MQYKIKQISLFNCYLFTNCVIIYQSLVKTSNGLNKKSSKNGSARITLSQNVFINCYKRIVCETKVFVILSPSTKHISRIRKDRRILSCKN